MDPTFSMPQGDDATTAATVAELRHTARALRCAIQLVPTRGRTAQERAVVAQMRRAARRLEEAIRRLPSRWSP
ncbi:MAG: hypothetical protein HY560_12885 [Gemmatimonadetes bacterium]|nr:hypothetical protein [Gemmatimonadota bacterium]